MQIIYQDDHLFAIDKPPGHFVHPPERSPYPVPPEKICLTILREMLKQDVFPVHRLDAPTSGIVIFTKSKEATRELSRLFMERKMKKTYEAVIRGFIEESGSIDIPLEIARAPEPVECLTLYRRKFELELPYAVGKKHPTARYSLVEVNPVTGRWHQIRRHFDRIAHPLIGDIEHGDTYHNRFFRDTLKLSGLFLRATGVEFEHPWTGETLQIEVPKNDTWARVYALFQGQNSEVFKSSTKP